MKYIIVILTALILGFIAGVLLYQTTHWTNLGF